MLLSVRLNEKISVVVYIILHPFLTGIALRYFFVAEHVSST